MEQCLCRLKTCETLILLLQATAQHTLYCKQQHSIHSTAGNSIVYTLQQATAYYTLLQATPYYTLLQATPYYTLLQTTPYYTLLQLSTIS